MKKITDNGVYTIIGVYGKQTRGGAVPPSPAVGWEVGNIIRETTDNKLYLRVAKTGETTDFILLN